MVVLTACASSTATISRPEQNIPCNAGINPSSPQFIIGYGSLMQEASRIRSAPNAKTVTPIHVSGFQRAWIAKGSDAGFSTTFLGAVADSTSSFNAVSFSVDAKDMAALDIRESGYCRLKVESTQLTSYLPQPLPAGEYWVYTNKAEHITRASAEKPIVQSYVDIFISGCLEQEQAFQLTGFTQTCIDSTAQWSKHWVNDRIYPRRPFIHQPMAGKIDQLLKQSLPEYFNNIRIE